VREILQKHLRRMYADDNLPKRVLNEARAFAAQGKYEAALEKYLWFHRHALEYKEALAGVRLSFALSEWVELGEGYPPARDALLAEREESRQAIQDGEGTVSLFHEVAAMNRCLREEAQTLQLFKLMHQRHPDLARECYELAEQLLVESGDYEICNRYLSDLEKRLEAIRSLHRMTLDIAAENSVLGSPEAGLKHHARTRLSEATSRLIAILEGVGRMDEAERVRTFVRDQEATE
jgi:tetratricopeptide (TPR) repeat protein